MTITNANDIAATSSDESFTPLAAATNEATSVDQAERDEMFARIDAANEAFDGQPSPYVIDASNDPKVVEARLKSDMAVVLAKFRENMVEEGKAYDSAEARHADLLQLGYENALDWLANKSLLRPMLLGINVTPAKDDVGLLGQIARLQLGDWTLLKNGNSVWAVPSRRDERLGRFYRIFFGDRAKWKPDMIADLVTRHKGKSGGILKAATPKIVKAGKKEVADNRERASRAKPKASVATDLRLAKQGEYRLVLVRSTSDGFDICDVVDDEGLTERLADKWAAEVAQTVPPKAV